VSQDDVVDAWQVLPRRIYLDTSTLQALYDYGGAIWEGEAFQPTGRPAKDENLEEQLPSLSKIFQVNERAMFEFVTTEATLVEVSDRGQPRYTQWVNDVRDAWLVQSAGSEVPPWGQTFCHRRFGMISRKDRILLQDALDLGCDAFLTMEKRLPRNAGFIERMTGLRVMRSTEYWALLAPWAKLYY
jgi:hypothetical protein